MKTEIRVERYKVAKVLDIVLKPTIDGVEIVRNYEANQYELSIYFNDGSGIAYRFTKNQSKEDIAIAMREIAKEILQLSEE